MRPSNDCRDIWNDETTPDEPMPRWLAFLLAGCCIAALAAVFA